MALGALPIGSAVVDWEAVVKGCTGPCARGVAIRALPGEVIGGSIFSVASDAIGGVLGGMVEGGISPRARVVALGTLPGVVVGRGLAGMAADAVRGVRGCMVKAGG